jgi:hypothetical protein
LRRSSSSDGGRRAQAAHEADPERAHAAAGATAGAGQDSACRPITRARSHIQRRRTRHWCAGAARGRPLNDHSYDGAANTPDEQVRVRYGAIRCEQSTSEPRRISFDDPDPQLHTIILRIANEAGNAPPCSISNPRRERPYHGARRHVPRHRDLQERTERRSTNSCRSTRAVICAWSKALASPRKKVDRGESTTANSLERRAPPARIATRETLRLGGSACCPCSPCSK